MGAEERFQDSFAGKPRWRGVLKGMRDGKPPQEIASLLNKAVCHDMRGFAPYGLVELFCGVQPIFHEAFSQGANFDDEAARQRVRIIRCNLTDKYPENKQNLESGYGHAMDILSAIREGTQGDETAVSALSQRVIEKTVNSHALREVSVATALLIERDGWYQEKAFAYEAAVREMLDTYHITSAICDGDVSKLRARSTRSAVKGFDSLLEASDLRQGDADESL